MIGFGKINEAERTSEKCICTVTTVIILLLFLSVSAVKNNKPPRRRENCGEAHLHCNYSSYSLAISLLLCG
jgi:hypothetical protein